MKTLAESMESLLESPTSQGQLVNPNGHPPLSRSSPRIEPEPLNCENDKEQFTLALSQTCIALKQYGKTPAELKAMRDMFLAVLNDIPVPEITKALFIHLNKSDEIPTPRQLRDIIYPPKPELSAAMYVKIMKDCTVGGRLLYGEKKEYVQAFEAQEMAKMRGGSEALREAKREIEGFQRLEYLEE